MATISANEFLKGSKPSDITVVQPIEQNMAPNKDILGGFSNYLKDTARNFTTNLRETAGAIGESVEMVKRPQGEITGTESFRFLTKPVAKAVETLFTPVTTLAEGAFGGALPKAVGWTFEEAMNVPEFKNIVTKADELIRKYPNETGLAGDIITIGSAFLGGKAVEKPLKSALETGISGVAKTAGKIAPAIERTGGILKSTGEGVYGLTVNPSEATAKALLNYDAAQPTLLGRIKNVIKGEKVGKKPITEAGTAARYGLIGTEYGLGVNARRVASRLWSETIEPTLNMVKAKVNMPNFIKDIRQTIIKETPELGRRNTLLEALDSFASDYGKVKDISLSKLQQYKEGWAKFIPDRAYKGKPIGAAFREIQNMAAGKARETIYNAVDEFFPWAEKKDFIKNAYIDYGNLQSIIESGAKSITSDVAKKSLGRNIWQFVMDKAVTPVSSIGGNILYRTGEGLELLGKEGAKTVKDIIGK